MTLGEMVAQYRAENPIRQQQQQSLPTQQPTQQVPYQGLSQMITNSGMPMFPKMLFGGVAGMFPRFGQRQF